MRRSGGLFNGIDALRHPAPEQLLRRKPMRWCVGSGPGRRRFRSERTADQAESQRGARRSIGSRRKRPSGGNSEATALAVSRGQKIKPGGERRAGGRSREESGIGRMTSFASRSAVRARKLDERRHHEPLSGKERRHRSRRSIDRSGLTSRRCGALSLIRDASGNG